MTEALLEAAANEDGTVIALGGSTPGWSESYPEIVDFNLNPVGSINQHFDVAMPTGTPSFFLHPSGALLYKAGANAIAAGTFPGGTVEIDDLHQFQPAAFVAFPEAFASSYSPLTDHMLTIDSAGRYLFGVTASGITMMELDIVPLSIGNIQPAFVKPQSGQALTVRGSGFEPEATVTIGGKQVSTSYVDEDTLKVETPTLPAGWLDVAVTLPDGMSYTAPSLLQVIAQQPTPRIVAFSPASALVLSTPPMSEPTVTISGSGFEIYDTVQIAGQQVSTAFIDSSHMQATIPDALLAQPVPISFQLISAYTGASNTLSLPLVNPIPKITGSQLRRSSQAPGRACSLSSERDF